MPNSSLSLQQMLTTFRNAVLITPDALLPTIGQSKFISQESTFSSLMSHQEKYLLSPLL
jgi:hypothetical protein